MDNSRDLLIVEDDDCTRALLHRVVDSLPLVVGGRPRLSLVSVGHPAAGNRISGDLSIVVSRVATDGTPARAIDGRRLALPIFAFPADVYVWRGQARER